MPKGELVWPGRLSVSVCIWGFIYL